MSPSHISLDTFFALKREETSPGQLRKIQYHLAGCQRCQELARIVLEGGQPEIPLEVYGRIVYGVSTNLLRESSEIEKQRSSVPTLWDELSHLSGTQRRLLVENSPRFQVWGLAEYLLILSRKGWSEDPTRSEELAELALTVIGQLQVEGTRARLASDLKAEAWSYIANCRRIRSDLHGADLAFCEAERYLTLGSGDPTEAARFLDLRSSLERARRNFEAARRLLVRVQQHYREGGDRQLEGRALVNEAYLLRTCGKPEASIQVLKQAESLLSPGEDLQLWFFLKSNLLLYLAEVGRPEEAQELLPEVRELGRAYAGRLERLRLLWTEGLLRKSLGQAELAAEALSQVREGFVAAEIGYDVALVSLDLAALYLETGRTEDARELATQSIPLFASRGVHREALAAWSVFREAAERDALTLGLVQEVAGRIRIAQSRPSGSADLP